MFKTISAFFLSVVMCSAQPSTNIMLYIGMQWSSNGVDWNSDWQTNGVDDVDFKPVYIGTNQFFRSQITNYWGQLGDWEAIGLDNWCGPDVGSITNHLDLTTLYVSPSTELNSNLVYRPVLWVTNYWKPLPCTNCFSGTNDNSPPPMP